MVQESSGGFVQELVSYYCNTFNRVHLLKNLLLSFEKCNVYEPYEWIITDYGSTDGTRDFLNDYAKEHKEFTVVLGSENHYADYLQRNGVKTANKKLMYAVMGMSRNVALQLSRGKLLVEIADDHQFIRKGDWVGEAKKILDFHSDVSSVIYRGLAKHRLAKPNNARSECKCIDNTEYYLSNIKGYDDYHITDRDVHNRIGRYAQPELLSADKLRRWNDEQFTHYIDYLERANALGFQKAFLRYPYAVDFPNTSHLQLKHMERKDGELIIPLVTLEEMKKCFSHTDPVSSDEIFTL